MTEDSDSVAFDPTRPFTRAAAAAQGNIRDLRTPSYRRLLHGIYVAATVEMTAAIMAEAALLPFGEKAWASHATAARVLGLPIPALPAEHVTVVERRRRRSRRDVICHLSRNPLRRNPAHAGKSRAKVADVVQLPGMCGVVAHPLGTPHLPWGCDDP